MAPEVEKRLSVVIAQEEEVRAIADEHLEREVALKAMLEDLRREDQVGGPCRALFGPAKSSHAKPRDVNLRRAFCLLLMVDGACVFCLLVDG